MPGGFWEGPEQGRHVLRPSEGSRGGRWALGERRGWGPSQGLVVLGEAPFLFLLC